MADVNPGSHKYSDSQSIPHKLGSDAARRGDALAVGADDTAVRTTGDNGFLGVLAQATQADADAGALGPGVDEAVLVASGDTATVAMQGVVRTKVSATVGGSVTDGDKIEAGASGALTNIDDGTGAPVQADAGESKAVSDEDADGYALVFLG
jgi:hypothetical protein